MSHRLFAFGIHLSGSALLALLAVALVYWVWYPAPLDVAAGVGGIFVLILSVDVVIGPLLTLVVYKRGKKSLVFDMTVIVLVQLAAFAYGIWTVAEGRPVWLVFNADRFDLVRANEVDRRKLSEADPRYRSMPVIGPEWVSAEAPAGVDQRNQILFEAVFAGVDLPQRPEFYKPVAAAAESIRMKARPISGLSAYNAQAQVLATMARWPRANAWLPLMSSGREMTVLVDTAGPEVIAIVDLRPWN